MGTPWNWRLKQRLCCGQGAMREVWSPWPAGPRTRCLPRCGPGWGMCAKSSSPSASSHASTGCRRSRLGWNPQPHQRHQRTWRRPQGSPLWRSMSGHGQSAKSQLIALRSCPGGGGRRGRNPRINPRRLRGGGDLSGRSRWSTRLHTALPWAAMSRWSGGASDVSVGWSGRSPANRRREPEESWLGGRPPWLTLWSSCRRKRQVQCSLLGRRCLSLASFPQAACPTGLNHPRGHLGQTGRGRGTGLSRDGGRGPERVVRAGEAGVRALPRPRAARLQRLHHRPLIQCSTRASCCASARSTLTASRQTGRG